jgi:hypothetical protein
MGGGKEHGNHITSQRIKSLYSRYTDQLNIFSLLGYVATNNSKKNGTKE